MTLDITCTDLFCGAGGSSTGASWAGADIRLAINHWDVAIETHNTNFPNTTHVLTDISRTDPRRFPRTTILIGSPECTNHTISKGRRRKNLDQLPLEGFGEKGYDPSEERSRCTMFDPLRWTEYHRYELVILENVVEARMWSMWPAWLLAWDNLGYHIECVYFNSMFAHPTPQSRDRMYIVAWKKGNRKPDLSIRPRAFCPTCAQNCDAVQCWKNPTRKYGKFRTQYVYCCPTCAQEVMPYYYPAATAIDWSRPIERIGDRPKPLQPKTMARIAYGLAKFKRDHPFTVQVNKTTDRVRCVLREPHPTQTSDNGLGLVSPLVMSLSHSGEASSWIFPAHERALLTQTGRDDVALVCSPFITELHGTSTARPVSEPLSTVCAGGGHHGLVMPPNPSWLMTYYNNGDMTPVSEASPTVTTVERHALVQALPPEEGDEGNDARRALSVEDCGFRMLDWTEIRAAMAFPHDYTITGTRKEKVKQLGNAVTAPVMKLLMERAIASLT